MKFRFYALTILLLWLAFGVRVYHLADLGTQADEGVHITAAERLVARYKAEDPLDELVVMAENTILFPLVGT